MEVCLIEHTNVRKTSFSKRHKTKYSLYPYYVSPIKYVKPPQRQINIYIYISLNKLPMCSLPQINSLF